MGERTAEGSAPSNALQPDPVGKPDPHKIDAQITAMVIERLRDGIGFTADVKTIDDVIEWVLERFATLDQAANSRTADSVYQAVEAASATPDVAVQPYANTHPGPLGYGDALSKLRVAEAKDPDGFHRQDAAAHDAMFSTWLATGGPLNPPLSDLKAAEEPRPEHEKTRRQHPPPVDDATRLSANQLGISASLKAGQPSSALGVGKFIQEMLATADIDAPSAFDILGVCMELAIFLMSKNKQYGDSALDPVRIMSSADPAEQLRVRMDDKLSRMFRGDTANEDEDVFKDLVGYWVLMRVAEKRAGG